MIRTGRLRVDVGLHPEERLGKDGVTRLLGMDRDALAMKLERTGSVPLNSLGEETRVNPKPD